MKEKIKNVLNREIRGAIKIGSLVTIGIGLIITLVGFVYEITVSSLKDSDVQIKASIKNVEAKNIEQDKSINTINTNYLLLNQQMLDVAETVGVPQSKIKRWERIKETNNGN